MSLISHAALLYLHSLLPTGGPNPENLAVARVNSPRTETKIAVIFCESRRDASHRQLLFLTVLFASEKPSEETISVLRVLPSVGVNLRCCFSCLNDSSETHLLDVGAQRERQKQAAERHLKMWNGKNVQHYGLVALVRLLFFPLKCSRQWYLQKLECAGFCFKRCLISLFREM